jgi:hypothetical protein
MGPPAGGGGGRGSPAGCSLPVVFPAAGVPCRWGPLPRMSPAAGGGPLPLFPLPWVSPAAVFPGRGGPLP